MHRRDDEETGSAGRHRHGRQGEGRGHRHGHGEGHGHGHRHGHRRGHGRGGRLFDYGELRLLLLAMIAERPSHGYELMKAIEERFGGAYSPSPGVIYPTLAWLDDMGYAAIEHEGGGRKLYSLTAEGKAFLAANREAIEALKTRSAGEGAAPPPDGVMRAMGNLKLALRLRFRRGPLEPAAAEKIAAAIDEAARAVETA